MEENTNTSQPDPSTSSRLQRVELELTGNTKVLGEMAADQAEILRILKGHNGTPGLVARVTDLEDTHVKCPVADLQITLQGKDEKIGVMERLRNLEKFQQAFEKLAWAVIIATVVQIFLTFIK